MKLERSPKPLHVLVQPVFSLNINIFSLSKRKTHTRNYTRNVIVQSVLYILALFYKASPCPKAFFVYFSSDRTLTWSGNSLARNNRISQKWRMCFELRSKCLCLQVPINCLQPHSISSERFDGTHGLLREALGEGGNWDGETRSIKSDNIYSRSWGTWVNKVLAWKIIK